MQKVIVTGGAGFIGSHVVDLLLAEGYEVHIVDNFANGKREDRINQDATLHEVDICDLKKLQPIFMGATYVFHLAANPRVQESIDNPVPVQHVNVDGTMNVLLAAREAKVQKVVFTSSAAVYGDQDIIPFVEESPVYPLSPYGLHKLTGEHLCRLWSLLYQVPTVSLRYFNVYGPRFDPEGAYPLVIGYFLHRRKAGNTLTITGDGTNTRDYVHVHDVARANLLAATSDTANGEVCNIASGTETSVLKVADLIGGEKEFIAPRIEPIRNLANITRAKNLLKWQPTISLEAGIEELKRMYLEG